MTSAPIIDITFDVRSDASGKDPDSHSKTLRRYHQLLWSKPLPSGEAFELDAKLAYGSGDGGFSLASDSIGHTYSRWTRPAELVRAVAEVPSEQVTAFFNLACTVGAYTVFPLPVHVGGKRCHSINQARGLNYRIRDRFDLTLECIRRHYLGETSPLSAQLEPYAFFFELFGDFRGYVAHFLLQDLVSDDGAAVRFFTDFDGFQRDPLPARDVTEYREYMKRVMAFIHGRNARVVQYADRGVLRLSLS